MLSEISRNRYSRQILLDRIGEAGQEKLAAGKVVIIGCGATGTNLANTLARAGVGYLRLIDRDFVELNNLQRQTLFDEADLEKPKALAAADKLKMINSQIGIDAAVADFNSETAETLISGMDLVLDGTDNMSTRFVINDIALKLGIPWIYSGAISSYGMTMNILPDGTAPCFRCFLPQPPRPGSLQTCDTAGVLNTVPQMITAYAATEALKLLLNEPVKAGRLIIADIWDADFRVVEVAKRKDCRACVSKDFEFLAVESGEVCTTLCGRNAVQVRPAGVTGPVNFNSLKDRLEKSGTVKLTEYTLIFKTDNMKITLFKDGRTIIQGVENESEARGIYSKYIGI